MSLRFSFLPCCSVSLLVNSRVRCVDHLSFPSGALPSRRSLYLHQALICALGSDSTTLIMTSSLESTCLLLGPAWLQVWMFLFFPGKTLRIDWPLCLSQRFCVAVNGVYSLPLRFPPCALVTVTRETRTLSLPLGWVLWVWDWRGGVGERAVGGRILSPHCLAIIYNVLQTW